jgi:ribosomal-protein-alanine N-acetyltransferase
VAVRTSRLLLRRWRDTDREPFAALNADPVVMEHFPNRLTRDESDAFVDRIEAAFDEYGYGLWAVESESGFIGYVGLQWTQFLAAVEIGWRLARPAWGQGYASEAAIAARDFAIRDIGLDEIVSFTTYRNERSQAVMRRIGMTHDPADDFEHPGLPADHPMRPHVLYRLTRETLTMGV